ncbi:MAG TPA: AbrB/MazE/SpoVT family DNA-binding domain-containing protein [Thermoanaerobaculia bacterium]|jgi:AbrB family looped-hinge helix DNA binding protein
MRITSKGQVTIPIDVRQRLGLLPHTEVSIEIDGDGVRLRKTERAVERRGDRLLRRMKGRATADMSTDEIMALTRGED